MSFWFVPRLAALVLCSASLFGRAEAAVPFHPDVPYLPAEVRLPRWEAAKADLARDLQTLRACLDAAERCPSPPLARWRAMMKAAVDLSWRGKLDAVNRHVNQRPYRRDQDRHGVVDLWSGPVDFLAAGGDCEDYAIAKYASLRLLGLPVSALRLVVLEDRARGLAHAVLAVREGTRVWILDNQSEVVERVEDLPHYDPYYAVNEDQRWLHRIPGHPAVAATR